MENFFWRDLADNYLEMAKQRLYDPEHPQHAAARLHALPVLLTVVKLLAPFLPYVTEEIYQGLFAQTTEQHLSIPRSWPTVDPALIDPASIRNGERLVAVATAVRRYQKRAQSAPGQRDRTGTACRDRPDLAAMLSAAIPDLTSITRAARSRSQLKLIRTWNKSWLKTTWRLHCARPGKCTLPRRTFYHYS